MAMLTILSYRDSHLTHYTSKWGDDTLLLNYINRTKSIVNPYSQPKQPKPSSRSKARPNPRSEPLIVAKKKQYDRPNTIRGFDRQEQQRNSAKWHTPRRQDMKRPNYDPYGAIDVWLFKPFNSF